MVEAELRLLANALLDTSNERVVLLSESTISTVQLLNHLLLSDKFQEKLHRGL